MTENEKSSNKVKEEPVRRKLTLEYKLKILQEIDSRKNERESVGEILRRENLYGSQVSAWRKSLEHVIEHGIPERKRGRKADPTLQLKRDKEKLEKKVAQLEEKNRQFKLIIEAQKKIAEMYKDENDSMNSVPLP